MIPHSPTRGAVTTTTARLRIQIMWAVNLFST